MRTNPARFLRLASLLLAAAATGRAQAYHRTPQIAYVLAQADAATGLGADGTLREVDRSFILQSLSNSRTEAELSRLAMSQATSSAVRDFAQQLVGDYGQINNALEALARRKAVAVPLQPTSSSDEYHRLAEQAGSNFDRAFIRRIAAASDQALRLCESAVADARDADVRALAGSLLPVLRAHVNTTTELRKSF